MRTFCGRNGVHGQGVDLNLIMYSSNAFLVYSSGVFPAREARGITKCIGSNLINVRPSVRPSVRASVRACVRAHYSGGDL